MSKLEFTGSTANINTNGHNFFFEVFRDNIGFVVKLTQTTSFKNVSGLEDMENAVIVYKSVCHHSKTEHSAIHRTGEKYIKNWDKRGRIGKDNMILSDIL